MSEEPKKKSLRFRFSRKLAAAGVVAASITAAAGCPSISVNPAPNPPEKTSEPTTPDSPVSVNPVPDASSGPEVTVNPVPDAPVSVNPVPDASNNPD